MSIRYLQKRYPFILCMAPDGGEGGGGGAQEPPVDTAAIEASMAAARKHDAPLGKKPDGQEEKATEKKPVEAAKPAEKPQEPAEKGGIKAMRAELEARGEELKTLRSQMTDFEGTRKERDELKARIGDLESQTEKYKKIESVAALEQSEEFQSKFVTGRNEHIEKLKELAGYAEISPDELLGALSKKGKDRVSAMEDILSSVGRYISDDIVQTVKAIDRLDSEKNSALSNASELLSKKVAERESTTRKQQEESARVRSEAWKTTESKLADELGLTAEQKKQAADFFANNKDAAKAAEITIKGSAYDSLAQQVAELKVELAKYQKASPGVSAGADTSGGDPYANLTVSERINKHLQDQGFSRR